MELYRDVIKLKNDHQYAPETLHPKPSIKFKTPNLKLGHFISSAAQGKLAETKILRQSCPRP